MDFPDVSDLPRKLAWFAGMAAIAAVLGILVLGALSQVVVPRLVQSSADRLTAQPWANVGYGLAWALRTPAIAGLLLFTLIGAPAAIVVMAGFIVLAALGFVTAGYSTGLWPKQRIKPKMAATGTWGRVGWTVRGLFVLLLMIVVPFVGWTIAALLFIAGLGAEASAVLERFRAADAS